MFDIGLAELAVIALVAILVFGPDRIPELSRQAGRMVRRLRGYATSARDDLRRELGPEFSDLELRDLDPRTLVRKHVLDAIEEDEREAARPRRPRPLAEGERPPYDTEAT